MSRITAGGRRRTVWTAVAALLLVLGITSAALAAAMVAQSDHSDSQRQARFQLAEIVSRLSLAIQHEQDLIFSASAFVTENPHTSDAQFVEWARSEHALARYPELRAIGDSIIVPADRLASFAAQAI